MYGKTFSLQYINIIRNTILFHENKLFPSEVIALLVTPHSIDWQTLSFFAYFLA